jgi:hypothetical protein
MFPHAQAAQQYDSQEAKKPRSQEAKKPRSQEAKKPRSLDRPMMLKVVGVMAPQRTKR